jgi:putative ATP-dependent endonuclease of the OLD family
MTNRKISLTASNLKCFGANPQGFDEIKTINLIVGRNNSGKSSLIDLVHQATLPETSLESSHWHKGRAPEIFVETDLTRVDISQAFRTDTAGGGIPGNHFEYGQQFIDGRARVRLIKRNKHELVQLTRTDQTLHSDISGLGSCGTVLANLASRNPFQGKVFRRLAAERDIVQEPDGQNASIEVHDNGRGITNMIQCFLNKSALPSDLVEEKLLGALNEVFGPDAQFTNIVCQQHQSTLWEIFLGQRTKGRIALSQSGSGLKTIIQALCFIHLLPVVATRSLDNYIFAFEELENNLHPALQRRLLTYIAKQAREHHFLVFLTTHSSVAIDIFNTQEDAQILHITHDGSEATCKTVKAFVEHSGVLDDLDVRASDLLQANGIIWVEGPSDRIYLNRWIELWSDGELSEGNHYQCVFYGGRLLAHLSGQVPDDYNDDGVSILKVNRNAIVVIDSDKHSEATPINTTKKRVSREIEAVGGLSWITQGREIENYISSSIVAKWRGASVIPEMPHCYDDFFSYLDQLSPNLGAKFSAQKPLLAEQLCSISTKEDLEANVELAERLTQICAKVRQWNSLNS